MKRLRHKAILDLVRTGRISSQEELMAGLQRKEIAVSQSTLSRDIQELKLAKTAGFYTVVEHTEHEPVNATETLRRIVREFLEDIDVAATIVVLKTGPANASPLSQALDDAGWPESAGSIAGEDTVFVAARSLKDARKIEKRLRELLE